MAKEERHSTHISKSLKDHILSLKLRLPFQETSLEKESPFSHISESLSLLEKQEEEYQSLTNSTSLKDHILSLKLGLHILEIFLSVSSNEGLKKRIEHVVYTVRHELLSFSNKPRYRSLILDLDRSYTNLRRKMKNVIMKPKTREYDVIIPELFWNGSLKKTSDFLLKYYGDLSTCKAPLMKEIEDIIEKLMIVQPLLTYRQTASVYFTDENEKPFTALVGLIDKALCLLFSCLVDKVYFTDENEKPFTALVGLIDKALCLLFSCLVDKVDEEMPLAMKHKLSVLLEKINVKEILMVVFGASKLFESTDKPLEWEFYLLDNLINLQEPYSSSLIYMNDSRGKLHKQLTFLKTFLEDLPQELRVEKFSYLVTSIEAITCKAIPILYSCYYAEISENMARDVHDQIQNILAEVRDINLYNYPKTDELGFLDLFLGHLEELLKCRTELIEILVNQIETLYVEFDFLRSSLRIIKEKHNEHEELKDLWTRIIHLAYQAEHVVDFYLVKYASDSRIMSSLSEIIEQTKHIKSKVTRIFAEENYHSQTHNVAKNSSSVPLRATDTTTDEVVGFEDEAEKIMEYLIGDPKHLDFISIVGMPGIGKTTLAQKMYEAPLLVEHFDVRAWCSVSQTYRKRELLLTILGDIIEVTYEINKLTDEEIATKLYQSLKGRRYLIVIDDMWDIKVWNDLVRILPDDKNHSRILITSRLQNVASQTKVGNGNKVHTLRQFSDHESWELFQKKLFRKESFSQEILEVGKQIVQSCKRLPLAIVVIAGLLAKVEKSVHKWKQIAQNLSSHIFSDSESQFKTIFEVSYDNLPDHLKSCFLFFGAFAEDEEIPVWKLKLLWIAEGFVRNTEEKSLEDVAGEYFMELFSRSLVIDTKERSLGGVKACRVHDLLHDFCLEKAKEESFLHVIHMHDRSKFSRVYNQRRLSIRPSMYNLMEVIPSGYSLRSLLHNTANAFIHHEDASFIVQNFKLLRVLDLSSTYIDKSFHAIVLLIHLRFLAVRTDAYSIPASIANLWNLQSFLVEINGKMVPDSLWNMVNLRHVHINHYDSFDIHSSSRLKNSILDNLDSLSTPSLSYGEDAVNLLRRLPKLRKLRCEFLECWDEISRCYQFPVLDFLDQLTTVKVFFQRSLNQRNKCEFKFPPNLQKLTLSRFLPSWDDISKIGRMLPHLKILKLIGNNFDGQWDVNDSNFPKLKYLKLSRLKHTREWIASEDSFPIIEQLVLDHCSDLEEIPPCFGEIPTLRMITVKGCRPSVHDSVRRIQMEQQEELLNEVKVYIDPRKQFYM